MSDDGVLDLDGLSTAFLFIIAIKFQIIPSKYGLTTLMISSKQS
jgi:hypothetical protein